MNNIKLVFMISALFAVALLIAACSGSGGNNTPAKNSTSASAKSSPASAVNAPPGAQPAWTAGSPTATVTLEEFADFQCPQCAAVYPVMNEIKGTFGSRIKFVFRNFPLKIPAHDKSYEAAVAVEAAGMQGKFWELMGELFTKQQDWTANPNYKQIWAGYAEKLGLNVAKWQEDCAGIAAKGRVDADMTRGNAMGVSSTPSIYINGMAVPFTSANVEGLKGLINAELAKAPAQGSAPANSAPAANTGNSNSGK